MLQRVFAFLVPNTSLSASAQASLSLLPVHFHPNTLQAFSLAKHDESNSGFALEEGKSSLQRLQEKEIVTPWEQGSCNFATKKKKIPGFFDLVFKYAFSFLMMLPSHKNIC